MARVLEGRPIPVATRLVGPLERGILRLRGSSLPLNPADLPGMGWAVAFNTAVSFTTNTNWQFCAGESTLSYLSQMTGLAVQNFASAAVGIAVMAAVVRGFARRGTAELGNFWGDLVRVTLYVLAPVAVVLGLVLASQGVIQTLDDPVTCRTLEARTIGAVDEARRPPRPSCADRWPRRWPSSTPAPTGAATTTPTRPYRSRTRRRSATCSCCWRRS